MWVLVRFKFLSMVFLGLSAFGCAARPLEVCSAVKDDEVLTAIERVVVPRLLARVPSQTVEHEVLANCYLPASRALSVSRCGHTFDVVVTPIECFSFGGGGRFVLDVDDLHVVSETFDQ